MIFVINKGFDFGYPDGRRKTVAPTFFQLTPSPAWGEGRIPFSVVHFNLDENGEWYNGTAQTKDVPFPVLELNTTFQQIIDAFFIEHPEYEGGTLLGTTWDQAKANFLASL